MPIVTVDKENIEIDDEFICSITQQVMRIPVTTADGHIYEKEAIERWLQVNNTSPKTGLELPHKSLQPNLFAKQMIMKLLDKHPELLSTDEVYLPQEEAVFRYCKNDNATALLERLSEDAVLLTRMFNGQNLWHIAAFYQAKKVLEGLIELTTVKQRQLALLHRDKDGNTPLHVGLLNTNNDDLSVVTLLLSALSSLKKIKGFANNRDSEATQSRLNRCAQMAVIENSVTRIALFRRLGAALTLPYLVNNHESLLHLAIKNSAWQAADYLVDHMNLSINELDKKGQSILYKAVVSGCLQQIESVLYYSPDVNQLHSNGETVLHKAITIVCSEKKRAKLIKSLLEQKANPNLRLIKEGTTPLQAACVMGELGTIQLLVAGGDANLLLRDQDGNTSFHLAIIHEKYDVLNYLLNIAPTLIIPADNEGNTVLHLLAKKGEESVLIGLLAKGVPYKLMNTEGECPLDIIKRVHPSLLPSISQAIVQYKQQKRQQLQEEINHLQMVMQSQDTEIQAVRGENQQLVSQVASQKQKMRSQALENQQLFSQMTSQKQEIQSQALENKQLKRERDHFGACYRELQERNTHLKLRIKNVQERTTVKSNAAAVGSSMSSAFQNRVERPRSSGSNEQENNSCRIM